MITKISLKNFKCFEEETDFDFNEGNLVAINGGSSSGKTSLLESILFLLKKLTKDENTNLEYYVFNNKKDAPIVAHIKYEFNVEGNKLEYGIDFTKEKIIWEYLCVDGIKLLERGEEKAVLYLEKPIVFEVEDKEVLFLKKLYLNTRFEGNDILKNWFNFIKRFLWLDVFSDKICMCNGVRNIGEIEIKPLDIELNIPLEMESRSNQFFARIMPFIENMVAKGSIMLIDDLNRMFDEKMQEKIFDYILENNQGTQFFIVSTVDNNDVVSVSCRM